MSKKSKNSISIYQLDDNLNIIKKYKSQQQVIDEVGGSKSNLSMALNSWNYKFQGYRYVKKDIWDKFLNLSEGKRWVTLPQNKCFICQGSGEYRTKLQDGKMTTIKCDHKIPRPFLEDKINHLFKKGKVISEKISNLKRIIDDK